MNTVLMREACQGLLGDRQFRSRLVCGEGAVSPGCQLLRAVPAVPSLLPTGASPVRSGPCCAQGLAQPHRDEAAPCGTAAAAQADRAQCHHSSTPRRVSGLGESHLFDIEQQQQLQHLHSWQEWSKENAQPGAGER